MTVLEDAHIRSVKTLATLADNLGPSKAILDVGILPWAMALDTAKGKLNKTDNLMFKAFLLRLSLVQKTERTENIITYSFDTVYETVNGIKPHTRPFEILSDLITPKTYWSNNDQRDNLIETIAYAFVHLDLSPIGFLQTTKNDKAFQEMIEALRYDYRGNRFLKEISRKLDSDETLCKKWSKRRKLIESAIRRLHWGIF